MESNSKDVPHRIAPHALPTNIVGDGNVDGGVGVGDDDDGDDDVVMG